MIKSLLEPEENQSERIKRESEVKTAGDSADDENFESYFAGIEPPPDASEPENLSDISEPADDALVFSEVSKETMPAEPLGEKTVATFDFSGPRFNQTENSLAETTNYEPLVETADEQTDNEPLEGFPSDEIDFDLPDEAAIKKSDFKSAAEISNETAKPKLYAETVNATAFESFVQAKAEESKSENSDALFQSSIEPESLAETARKSGMAYAAVIALFASIVFMLIIGWFADLLLGSSPLGVVAGIILGAAIGFFQFFRLTAQIFKNKE